MNAGLEIKLDLDRTARLGVGEAIFCAGKSTTQIESIIAAAAQTRLLFTRLDATKYAALSPEPRELLSYDPVSRTATLGVSPGCVLRQGLVAIMAAGTSDAPAAREAEHTLRFHGVEATMVFDVGVAGIWRLMERVGEIGSFPVIIVAAGMDAALPSVLGGLVPGAIIALPTSTGYGAARCGETALAACLTSCAPGIVVVNIDNGFGAATAALRILSAGRAARVKDDRG